MSATHLVKQFFQTAKTYPDRAVFFDKIDAIWQPITYRQAQEMTKHLASALLDLGLKQGDRVILCSPNSSKWAIADLAIMAAGGIVVPAYTTHTIDDFCYMLTHSEANIVISMAGDIEQKIRQALNNTAKQNHIHSLIFIGNPVHADIKISAKIYDYDYLISTAKPNLDIVGGNDGGGGGGGDEVACIIYTSGTGGNPKGVMLTHDSIQANIEAARYLLAEGKVLDGAVFLSILPLAHAYEHTAGLHLPIQIGAQIYYAEGADKIAANLAEARPTVMTAVPRLYEVLHDRISKAVQAKGGVSAYLFAKAVLLGRKKLAQNRLTALEWLADSCLNLLVRRKIAKRFGGNLRYFVSGGATLTPEIGTFFLSLGVNILQGYGQTEASPLISANRPHKIKIETVGEAVHGIEVKLAADGELLVKGNAVMKGYWRDQIATDKTIIDGCLHTGDLAAIDGEGYITITGRKKDMIVNSGGDNISPARIEVVMTQQPEIAQIMVFGDKRPFLSAVIVGADDDSHDQWDIGDDPIRAQNQQQIQNQQRKARIKQAVDRGNQKLASFEKLRRFIIADRPFTIENKQMTPTLKVRRHIVIEYYQDRLERLYKKR